MVDLRKLFNQLEEICEEEVVSPHDGEFNLSAIELNPDIGEALVKLKEGMDSLEKEAKERVQDAEDLKEKLDDIVNSLY